MPDHSLSRLKQVFGGGAAHWSLAIGLVGPLVYVFGYLLAYNTGVDASQAGTGPTQVWRTLVFLWMIGLPLIAVPGVILGIYGFERDGRLPAGVGILASSVWLLVWLLFVLLLVTGVTV